MKDMVKTLDVVALTDRKSHGVCYSRMKKYWKNQYGVNINADFELPKSQRSIHEYNINK